MRQLSAFLTLALVLQLPAVPSRAALDTFLGAHVAAGDAPAVVAVVVTPDSTFYRAPSERRT